jgi:uncharacterized protein (DUF2267 family)
MDHDQFVAVVEQVAGVDRQAAERATRATLQTLAERLSREEARDLVEQLPPELGPWLVTDGAAERFDVDEFLGRVAGRAEVDLSAAERQARAVLPLLPQGPAVEVLPAEVFQDRVAGRAGLDVEGARRATEAVLETLAERIADGEVDDLIGRLPLPLHDALKRGKARSPGAARMSLDRGGVLRRHRPAPTRVRGPVGRSQLRLTGTGPGQPWYSPPLAV